MALSIANAPAPGRRRFIAAPLAALALPPFAVGFAAAADELTIRYLGWAGVELRYGANAVFIDPQLVFRDQPARGVATAAIESPVTTRPGGARAARRRRAQARRDRV